MKSSDLPHIFNRRYFLAGGVSLLSAVAVQNDAKAQPNDLKADNDSTTKPGLSDDAYGQPASYESHIQRKLAHPYDVYPGYSYTTAPIHNQRGIITPNGLHFSVHHSGIPEINPEEHELKIHGLVDRPLKYSVLDLLRYPMDNAIYFIECAGNSSAQAVAPEPMKLSCQDLYGQMSGAEWAGIRLSTLLIEAGLKPSAKWIIAEGADAGSHSRSIPIEKAMDDAIIVLYQNGERIRPSQGYPLRLLLPGWEGNMNVKWLHRLEVSDQPAYTKDESAAYAETLRGNIIQRFSFFMDVKSVITHPSPDQILPEKGYYEISGLAWSGYGKIKQVEISTDNGKSWMKAELQNPVLNKAFSRFSANWRWDGQPTVIISRAMDEKGYTQPSHTEWKSRFTNFSYTHYNAVQGWLVTRDGEVHNHYVE